MMNIPAFAEATLRREIGDQTRRADRWMLRCHVALKLLEDWLETEGELDPLIERTRTYLEGVKANRAEPDAMVDQLHGLKRYAKAMTENNTWLSRKLERIGALVESWRAAPNLQVEAETLDDILNGDEGQPRYPDDLLRVAFFFRDDREVKLGNATVLDCTLGDGFGRVTATADKLAFEFFAGGVHAVGDLPYPMLRARLADVGLGLIEPNAEEQLDALAIAKLQTLIRRAGALLHDVLYECGCSADPAITEWLSDPEVKAVVERGLDDTNLQLGPVQGDGASEPKPD